MKKKKSTTKFPRSSFFAIGEREATEKLFIKSPQRRFFAIFIKSEGKSCFGLGYHPRLVLPWKWNWKSFSFWGHTNKKSFAYMRLIRWWFLAPRSLRLLATALEVRWTVGGSFLAVEVDDEVPDRGRFGARRGKNVQHRIMNFSHNFVGKKSLVRFKLD